MPILQAGLRHIPSKRLSFSFNGKGRVCVVHQKFIIEHFLMQQEHGNATWNYIKCNNARNPGARRRISTSKGLQEHIKDIYGVHLDDEEAKILYKQMEEKEGIDAHAFEKWVVRVPTSLYHTRRLHTLTSNTDTSYYKLSIWSISVGKIYIPDKWEYTLLDIWYTLPLFCE